MPSARQIVRVLLPLTLISGTFALPSLTYVGCFSSSTGLTENSTYTYQSSGWCQQVCVDDDEAAVLGLTGGDDCWCGNETPPTDTQVDDSKCDSSCTGYGEDDCGGNGYWSVYLTGEETDVDSASDSSSTSSSAAATSPTATSTSTSTTAAAATTTTAAATSTVDSKAVTSTTASPSVVTSYSPGKTVVVTEAASSTSTSAATSTSTTSDSKKSSGGSSDTVGIAVGVVVGVIAIAAIAGAVFFFLRHKRSKQRDEEYKQGQAASFVASGKPQIPAMRRSPGPESRVDPDVLAQHRMSDGSIADNEDFSRRILKVTNPDDR